MEEDDSDNTKDSFTPRPYQVQLMEIAIKQNTIIYLPTGSGKTFIAILVLKHLSKDLNRPYSEGGKISLILVNSVALVDQHVKYIKDHTCFRVKGYTGEMNLDFWSKELWEAQYNEFQVLVMTTQILVNTINTKFIDLSKVSLIIFDECHRGVDDQPMRQVMKNFQNYSELPRILGLTATLLNGNCKLGKVMEKVQALETTYLSKVATVDGLKEVVGFSTNPQEQFTFFRDESKIEIIHQMVELLETTTEQLQYINIFDERHQKSIPHGLLPYDRVDILKRLRNFILDLKIHIQMLGVFGGWKSCLAQIIQIERIKVHCDDAKLAIILGYVQTVFDLIKTRLERLMENGSLREKIHLYSSDKLRRLFQIFKEFPSRSKEELCCLVFVQRRVTAKVLNLILTDLSVVDPDFYHLKSNFVVGNHNNPYNSATRENQFISKKNREILQNFVNKEYNVLIASNVLEEGVDIPKCTLVIKFDKAEDYRSYIQSKGRARHKLSIFYSMIEHETAQKYLQKYNEFQAIEKCLNELLVGKNDERDDPSSTDIDDMFNEDELEPYFVNGKNSAKVDMISAISLLCQYCNSLGNNTYTVFVPEWYIKKYQNKQRVVIYLPLLSGITDPIEGRPMSNKKNAKRAAALEACKLLHKRGELDDNLLPLKKTVPEEDVSYLFQHQPTTKEERAGLKNMKRLHSKHTPNCLLGDLMDKQYLHVIKLKPSYQRIEEYQNFAVYDMYTTKLCFGFLTPKPLINICSFPIYDSNGEIVVELIVNVAIMNLSKHELYQLRQFHFTVFNDVLEVLKPFLMFDNSGCATDILLVVPIQNENNIHIDFDILKECKFVKPKHEELTSTERIQLHVTEETHLNKIVIPWYRPQPTMYLVTKVCMDKTPSSNFPNEDYSSFKAYFEEKHNLRTLNSSQPLILVKGLSKRLNTHKPAGLEKKKKREKRYEELEEFLIPEFVVKQDFPACLWIQARFLPTILSRVVFLLKLQQLQHQIAKDIDASLKPLQTLQLDYNLLNYVPLEMRFLKPTEVSVSSAFNDWMALESPPLLTHQFNKDFLTKKLESEYSWKNIEEPKDIERDSNVTAAEIEYYEKFINHNVNPPERVFKNESPIKTNNYPAITYDLDYRPKDIEILDIKYDNRVPNLCDFYRALTAAEANDIMNLERLETLGDSFLKFAATLYVVLKFPSYNEGRLTTLRSRLISNKNLYYAGVAKNLGGILKNRDLSPSEEWSPPYFCVPPTINYGIVNREFSVSSLFNFNLTHDEQISGILHRNLEAEIPYEMCQEDEENSYASMCHFLQKQYVGDKTLADCVEALLGAFFQSGGVDGALKFIEWIGIIPRSENIKQIIEQVDINPVLNPKAGILEINYHLPQCEELEKRLGYRFRNRAFLLQALSHSSYTPNRITLSYEKLEFIGDAILDFLLTCYIFENCGNLNPGEVTDLRSALVNNNTFASLAVRNGFHKFMLMINSLLQKHIDQFASYLHSKNYVIDDEVLILLEEGDLNMADYLDVPKVLGDLFEALAGAVFLDSGKNLKTVWKVFYKIMWREIHLFSKNVPKNVLRRLYECHAAYPSFNEAASAPNNRTMLALDFICEGRRKRVYGFGSNKTQAKKAAAKIALRSLKL